MRRRTLRAFTTITGSNMNESEKHMIDMVKHMQNAVRRCCLDSDGSHGSGSSPPSHLLEGGRRNTGVIEHSLFLIII